MDAASPDNNESGEEPDGFRFRSSSDGPSVLVIERNESIRTLMQRAVGGAYRIRAAATFEEGRRRAEAEAHDGVVVGIYHRDVGEGIELMRSLREMDDYAEAPIIVVCRPSLERTGASLREAGFDDVLRMPFTQSELLSVLDRHLSDF